MKHSEIIERFRGSTRIITTHRDWEYNMYLSVYDMDLTTLYLKRESK